MFWYYVGASFQVASRPKPNGRASNIIQNITGVAASMVSQALELVEGSVKDAILIALGCSAAKVSKILEQSHGNMRKAMSSIKDMKNGISPQLKQGGGCE